jgi:hypothetical protein
MFGADVDSGDTTAGEAFAAGTAPIVGGIVDVNHRYVVGVGGNTRAFCSGTVISRRTVLTAGHCIGSVKNVFIGNVVTGGQGMKIAVTQQVRHPKYAPLPNENATYDLGILELAEDAPVQAAPLLRTTLENTPRFIGPSFVFAGFGNSNGTGGGFGTKRVTTFPIQVVGPAEVGGSYGMLPETLFYYADKNGRNTCNGDSGGPAFFVERGVEQVAGVTSSGDASCMLDGGQGRSDQPYIDEFIQPHLDAFEGQDPCRSNGVCDETCNLGGQLGDPDCAFAHCGADGICAEACVAPLDPDCTAIAKDNCGDNGVCDPTCAADPDCTRDCGAEGNCIPDCATPDPDCKNQGGADAGSVPGAPDGGPEADAPDAGPGDPGADDDGTGQGADCTCRSGGAGRGTPPYAAMLWSVLGVVGIGMRGRWRGKRRPTAR